MKIIVIFYSYTGHTRKIAQDMASKENADIYEIKERKLRNKFNAYVFGSFQAMKQKKADIAPINIDLQLYDKIIIMMPIWAGFPAPSINNVIEILPAGKEVEVISISASGSSRCSEKIKNDIQSKVGKTINYIDIKA